MATVTFTIQDDTGIKPVRLVGLMGLLEETKNDLLLALCDRGWSMGALTIDCSDV